MREIIKIKLGWSAAIMALVFLTAFPGGHDLYGQDDFSVGGFIDEDGDGFNDLLPDSDGDGVPDGLDPDSETAMPDSGYMHRYMHNFEEQHQMMWENMNGQMTGGHMEHGEPGMYGPGDSTMHGGQGGGHGGGGHHGGGMGGDPGGGMGGGGMGGGMEPGGGMGPDSEGGSSSGVVNDLSKPVKEGSIPDSREVPAPDRGQRSSEEIRQNQEKSP